MFWSGLLNMQEGSWPWKENDRMNFSSLSCCLRWQHVSFSRAVTIKAHDEPLMVSRRWGSYEWLFVIQQCSHLKGCQNLRKGLWRHGRRGLLPEFLIYHVGGGALQGKKKKPIELPHSRDHRQSQAKSINGTRSQTADPMQASCLVTMVTTGTLSLSLSYPLL